jgi:hypothetical protein
MKQYKKIFGKNSDTDRFKRYENIGIIGEGSQAVVFKVKDKISNKM